MLSGSSCPRKILYFMNFQALITSIGQHPASSVTSNPPPKVHNSTLHGVVHMTMAYLTPSVRLLRLYITPPTQVFTCRRRHPCTLVHFWSPNAISVTFGSDQASHPVTFAPPSSAASWTPPQYEILAINPSIESGPAFDESCRNTLSSLECGPHPGW